MKTILRRRFLPLATVLLGLAAFHGAPVHAGSVGPIGDLTVTVQERADGGVDFELSGSTTYKTDGSLYYTPYEWGPPLLPPTSETAPEYESIELPPGLQFLREGNPVPVQRVYFSSGLWHLQVDSSNSYGNAGDTFTGTGSIEAPSVPYSHFSPGTFVVEGGRIDITYRVLPFSPPPSLSPPPSNPRLRVPAAQRFAPTRARSSSRTQRVRIASVGDATVTGIRVRLLGAGARHFRVSQVASRSLDPGQRTTYAATFRPRSAGRHRAVARVTSNAPTVRTRLIGRATLPLPSGPRVPLR